MELLPWTVAVVLALVAVDNVQACGSVDMVQVTTTPKPGESTTTKPAGRKRRSIDDVATVTLATNIDGKQQPPVDVDKLAAQIITGAAKKGAALQSSEYTVTSFVEVGKLFLRYTLHNTSCQHATHFASAAKLFNEFIVYATIECDNGSPEKL